MIEHTIAGLDVGKEEGEIMFNTKADAYVILYGDMGTDYPRVWKETVYIGYEAAEAARKECQARYFSVSMIPLSLNTKKIEKVVDAQIGVV